MFLLVLSPLLNIIMVIFLHSYKQVELLPNGTTGGVFIYPNKEEGAPPQASHWAGSFYFTMKEVFRWLTIKRIFPTLGR